MKHFQRHIDEATLNTFNGSPLWEKKKTFGNLGTYEKSGTYTAVIEPVRTPPNPLNYSSTFSGANLKHPRFSTSGLCFGHSEGQATHAGVFIPQEQPSDDGWTLKRKAPASSPLTEHNSKVRSVSQSSL